MHISEGVLATPVLLTGGALTAAGVAYGLKKMDYERVPQVAVTSCVFFVASLIHVPIGPANMHLVLSGLTGILLGWTAFPAILAGLLLQAIMFQFGGLSALGVNTLNLALPAVLCYLLFGRFVRLSNPALTAVFAFLSGAAAIGLSGVMVAISLLWSQEAFLSSAQIILLAHIPIMIIEGIVTMVAVGFLRKVKIDILEVPHARSQADVR